MLVARLAILVAAVISVAGSAAGQDAAASAPLTTYRVLVSTDLGGDPDDIQSLYRLLHYSDVLKLEGIVSSPGPGAKNDADLVKHWIQRVDVDHLRSRGHTALITEADALAIVRQGQKEPGAPSPARRTPGSHLIIERAHAADPEGKGRPLWVQVWGSLTDVAQALHDDPSIAPKIRLYVIGSSNTTADPASRDYVFRFMKAQQPDLWWIENGILPRRKHDTFRGVYQGGDQSGEWGNVEFINQNIRGRGTTHGGLFEERCGDAFPVATSPRGTLKEGDSPAMLFLLSPVFGGVGNIDDPTQESWGGQFRRADAAKHPNHFIDLDADADTCQATISKWRVPFLSHWKQRWQWYETPAAEPAKTTESPTRSDASPLHRLVPQSPADLQELFRFTGERLPLVSAHRGGARPGFPENCIATFEHTLESTYAILEVDPRMTSDGQIVLHHDATLERTTTGSGKLAERTLAELRMLRLKDPDGSVTPYSISTLDEALEWARGRTVLLLDRKDVSTTDRVRKVTEHRAESYAMLIVYSFDEAKECHRLNPGIMMEIMVPDSGKAAAFDRTGVPWRNVVAFAGHTPPQEAALDEAIHQRGASCIVGSSRNIDKRLLAEGTASGRTPGSDSGYRALLDLGADLIETDLPWLAGGMLIESTPVPAAKAQFFRRN